MVSPGVGLGLAPALAARQCCCFCIHNVFFAPPPPPPHPSLAAPQPLKLPRKLPQVDLLPTQVFLELLPPLLQLQLPGHAVPVSLFATSAKANSQVMRACHMSSCSLTQLRYTVYFMTLRPSSSAADCLLLHVPSAAAVLLLKFIRWMSWPQIIIITVERLWIVLIVVSCVIIIFGYPCSPLTQHSIDTPTRRIPLLPQSSPMVALLLHHHLLVFQKLW